MLMQAAGILSARIHYFDKPLSERNTEDVTLMRTWYIFFLYDGHISTDGGWSIVDEW